MAALDGALTAVPEDSATETAVLLLRPRAAPGAYGRAPSAVTPAGTTRPGRRTGLAALHDPPRPGHVYGVLGGFPHGTATPGSARGGTRSPALRRRAAWQSSSPVTTRPPPPGPTRTDAHAAGAAPLPRDALRHPAEGTEAPAAGSGSPDPVTRAGC
ncbi:hypothetical protein CH313_01890 [Streptomyces sp. TSRI0384-2]|nr:hypothetical protein CH313_01890 [Streptomyces sp. TSRI0384-2]GFH65510.1 hypothetical protein Srut_20240 [Streptomyces rutgersensis]